MNQTETDQLDSKKKGRSNSATKFEGIVMLYEVGLVSAARSDGAFSNIYPDKDSWS